MAGEPDVVDKLKKGYKAIGRTYKNHIDGFNLLPYLTGKAKESPRKLFVYISDDGDVLGIRYDNWKMVFMEQRCQGTMQVWAEPFTRLRMPKIFNLRTDPYEFADVTSNTYCDWYPPPRLHHLCARRRSPAKFAETFKDFPADPEAEHASPSTTRWRRCRRPPAAPITDAHGRRCGQQQRDHNEWRSSWPEP